MFTEKWCERQAKAIVKRVHEETREAWNWMTPRMREALVHEAVFDVIRQQDRGVVTVPEMDMLLSHALSCALLQATP